MVFFLLHFMHFSVYVNVNVSKQLMIAQPNITNNLDSLNDSITYSTLRNV